jgi:hypothetical protein
MPEKLPPEGRLDEVDTAIVRVVRGAKKTV